LTEKNDLVFWGEYSQSFVGNGTKNVFLYMLLYRGFVLVLFMI
jgi:hypothetical protein